MQPPSSSSASSHRPSKPPSLCRFLQTCKCISLDDVALPSRIPVSDVRSRRHPDNTIPTIDRRPLHYPPPSRIPPFGDDQRAMARWIPPLPPDDTKKMASCDDSLACHLQEEDQDSWNSGGMSVRMIDRNDLVDEEDAYGEACKEMDVGEMADGGGRKRQQQQQQQGSGYGDCLCKDCGSRNYMICCTEMEEFEAISHSMKLLQNHGGDADQNPWCGDTMNSHGSSSSRLAMRAPTPNSKTMMAMDHYRIWEDCVLQEKYSYHAYDDFYDSMLEIVILKRIIELRDLKKLLACYFSINPPVHHDLIEEAFVNLIANVYYQNNDSLAS